MASLGWALEAGFILMVSSGLFLFFIYRVFYHPLPRRTQRGGGRMGRNGITIEQVWFEEEDRRLRELKALHRRQRMRRLTRQWLLGAIVTGLAVVAVMVVLRLIV